MHKSIYKTMGEWAKADPRAYRSASNLGCLREIAAKFGWKAQYPNGHWNVKENCINEEHLHPNTNKCKDNSNN